MVGPSMDRNRGRHQRESRFESNRRKQQDFAKRGDVKVGVKDEDKNKPNVKEENSSERIEKHERERKGQQKIIVDAETGQKKFTGRCRLFVGNIPSDTKEDDFREMFKPYGESSEIFLNPSRGFGFIRLDTRENAEKAKAALDGVQKKGRTLRVRFATHGAALKVKFLPSHVSNELLEEAFTQFGDVERAVVIVDDRGKPTGEGIVEFARKPGALAAIKQITNGCFIMGSTPRPIAVEALEQKDDEDGNPEKFINKTPEFLKEREQGPRFAQAGSFEFDFCQKWKELYRMEEEQKKQLDRQMEEACLKVEMEMETAAHEYQAMLLRQDLQRKQEELQRLEEQHRMELQRRIEQKQQEFESRRRDLDRYSGMGDRMSGMVGGGEMDKRRRMDMEQRRTADLFANERAMREMGRGERGGNVPPIAPPPAPPASLGVHDRQRQMGGPGMGMQGNMGQQLRQSRFDQPPANVGGGFGGNQMQGGPNQMERMDRGGRGGSDRRGGDEFFEAKRARRF